MTTGSPARSFASGPGALATNAICFESGDHATVLPVVGRGLLVPPVSWINFAPLPSARATHKPDLPAANPIQAMALPSGDHSGFPPRSFSAPRRTLLPSVELMVQICEDGRPDSPLVWTV